MFSQLLLRWSQVCAYAQEDGKIKFLMILFFLILCQCLISLFSPQLDSEVIEGPSRISLNCPIRYAIIYVVYKLFRFFILCNPLFVLLKVVPQPPLVLSDSKTSL